MCRLYANIVREGRRALRTGLRPTSAGLSKKQESFQKNISFCFIAYAKAFDYVGHNKLWKILHDLVCCNSWGRKELDTTERLN